MHHRFHDGQTETFLASWVVEDPRTCIARYQRVLGKKQMQRTVARCLFNDRIQGLVAPVSARERQSQKIGGRRITSLRVAIAR